MLEDSHRPVETKETKRPFSAELSFSDIGDTLMVNDDMIVTYKGSSKGQQLNKPLLFFASLGRFEKGRISGRFNVSSNFRLTGSRKSKDIGPYQVTFVTSDLTSRRVKFLIESKAPLFAEFVGNFPKKVPYKELLRARSQNS